MENKQDIKSVLRMEKMVFDKIEFHRLGFKSDEQLKLQMQTNVSKNANLGLYRTTLILKGIKEEEYNFEIELTGFFSFDTNEDLTEEMKETLLSKNSIAILLPYLRSEVSILTAQPGVDCVVLPILNVNNMTNEK